MIDGIIPNLNPPLNDEVNKVIHYLSADPLSRHSSLTSETILYAMHGSSRMSLVPELETTLSNALRIILVSNGDVIDLTHVQARLWILEKGLELALLREKNTKDIASIIQGVSQEDRDWLLISSAKRGQGRMVDLLLNHSYFDSNICGLAFERACEAGQLEVAKKLVKDRFIPENYKKTAFDKAVKNEHDHVVQHLFPAMQSKQNIPSTPQRTYLPMQKSVNPKKSTLEMNEISDPLEIVFKSYRVSKL